MNEGRTWRTWQLLVGIAVALVVGILAGRAGRTKTATVAAIATTTLATAPATTATTVPTTKVTTPPTTAAPTTVAGPKTIFGDGNYRVGKDIAPGTYRSSGTGDRCYWKRLSNFTGSDDIIANYLSNSPTTVTILATDAGFQTQNCGTWSQA
jgi:hypothetical protein